MPRPARLARNAPPARSALVALVGLVALAGSVGACSSGESPGSAAGSADSGTPSVGSDSGATPSGPFALFCTGTTLRALRVMSASSPGAWELSTSTLPQGSTFLVGIASSGGFDGYAVTAGVATRIGPGASSGLQLGTDFASSCVSTPQSASKLFTVLEDSTLYADKAKTGAPCTVSAGTSFDDYGFSGGVPASLSSTKLTSACGFNPGYTSDLVYGMLVVR